MKTRLLVVAMCVLSWNSYGSTFLVTTTADSGAGSLRQAITDSNTAGGTNTIAFNIPGGGVKTIYADNTLPSFFNPTTLDGYTQPGAKSNTLAIGSDAILLIELTTTNNSQQLISASPGCLVR